MQKFIHLRCHTNYSVLEGCLDIAAIADLCVKNNFPAIAMTDTNNMFGAREFSYKLHSAGIQPILGLQIDTVFIKDNKNIKGELVLLAKNENGYKNLLKIHDKVYKDKAQNLGICVSLETILEYSADTVCLSGGMNGLLAAAFADGVSEEIAEKLKNSFGGDFYIELNRFFKPKDMEFEPKFLELAKKHNIPIVATNNIAFAVREDFEAADVLLCIGQSVVQTESNRKVAIDEAYFKSAIEMCELFKDLPEAIENTLNIAKKCCFFVEKQDLSLPQFSENEINLITSEANAGLQWRLSKEVYPRYKLESNATELDNATKEEIRAVYQARLDFELGVIIKMGFAGYFLIVSDFIKYSKDNDIPVGPGRGSGAGSLVAWCLKITDVDPIQFSLLFERFLNPDRISMPDFDIDFCTDRRDEVVAYVQQKYGEKNVAHIITFGTLQTKAAIKDVGRVMGLPYSKVDGLTKKIPYSPPSNPINLQKVIAEPAIKADINSDDDIKRLFEIAVKLEGLYRNTSTHAAGVVISQKPLSEVVPLYYDEDSPLPSVGFSMKYIEDVGLVKFDFLALKTLTVINNAVKLIKKYDGVDLDILNIPYKDKKIEEMFLSGETLGVFQMESRGMTDVIRQFKPDRIEDVIAIIALYRPGPMDNIPLYINNKNNIHALTYQHHKIEPILKETYGVMVYQEQVMQVAQVIGGYTLGAADILRRAMGKKDPVEMEKQRNVFIDGAIANNNDVNAKLAGEIFDQMEKFAGYGFNKSHATAYALLSWQTAYLKTYYGAEFLAASMTADIGSATNQEKFVEYIEEAKNNNIPIMPPSLNYPATDFAIEMQEDGRKAIRYSLLAIKGIGEAFVNALAAEINKNGKFTSLENFLQRVDAKLLNKKSLESLIKSGSLDDLHSNRKELAENLETLLSFNSNAFNDKNSNQINLFDAAADANKDVLHLAPHADWSDQEKRAGELEILGYFLSGHPLGEFEEILTKQQVIDYRDLLEYRYEKAYLAGYLMKVKISKSKNGSSFASLSFYDKSSVFNLPLFGDSFNKYRNLLVEGKNFVIKVGTKIDGDDFRIFVESMELLNHSYKFKKAIDYSNKKAAPAAKVNLSITLNSSQGLESLSDLIINKEGVDECVIRILNGEGYLVFSLKNIMIMESRIEDTKLKPYVSQIIPA
ncbi:MAG: DNA polymerase III subunit alpha [Alphaproteobacteria bacterium]|nr:DNA polymerase III subunit alpha [Alphaproteobacteria bacterium]